MHSVPASASWPLSPDKVTAIGLDRERGFGLCIGPEENERSRRGCRVWGEAGRVCVHTEEAKRWWARGDLGARATVPRLEPGLTWKLSARTQERAVVASPALALEDATAGASYQAPVSWGDVRTGASQRVSVTGGRISSVTPSFS